MARIWASEYIGARQRNCKAQVSNGNLIVGVAALGESGEASQGEFPQRQWGELPCQS